MVCGVDRHQVSGGVLPSPHFLHNMPEVLICPSWLCVGIKGQGKIKNNKLQLYLQILVVQIDLVEADQSKRDWRCLLSGLNSIFCFDVYLLIHSFI